ncbi:MAG: DUF1674 domain-containing protein [Steroidobacteraceae bacterium]
MTPHNEDQPRIIPPLPAASQTPSTPAHTTRELTARELGGPLGPEPTRYGDWELRGRCIDF